MSLGEPAVLPMDHARKVHRRSQTLLTRGLESRTNLRPKNATLDWFFRAGTNATLFQRDRFLQRTQYRTHEILIDEVAA